MVSFRIYCISIFDEIFEKIKNIHCLPVGLGNNISNPNWLRDNTLKNISNKNKNYGELTFYYWFWKNELENVSGIISGSLIVGISTIDVLSIG